MQHEVLDEISLELGRRVAARLRKDANSPALVRCYREWQSLLTRPLEEICRVLEMDNEENRRLRQNSPFPGVLSPREVWAVKSSVRKRYA